MEVVLCSYRDFFTFFYLHDLSLDPMTFILLYDYGYDYGYGYDYDYDYYYYCYYRPHTE